MELPDCTESLNIAKPPEDNPDLEEGEIDDDDDEIPSESNNVQNEPCSNQILPAAVPVDTNIFTHAESKEKKKHSSERKSEKHLTEAEKCVRMLHKMERAERERRERLRREQMTGTYHQMEDPITADDWAGNVEKAIANVLKKEKHSSDCEEDDEKRGRKRKKKERDRKKKHRKLDSPKNDEVDEEDMMNLRSASPENKHHDNPPPLEGETYESYESEYEDEQFHNRAQNKRNFDRDRKRRNRDLKRERKNFRDKNRKKENEPVRPQMQDATNLCVFYMQGKCHKGDDCTFSHDALPPMKMELCKFYLMDCCAKRDKCLYMHSEFPCKYYHTGLKCYAKDNCKFAHGRPLSENLKQILLKHLETAPKEILGDFPRLSREGAQNMVNQTQKNLELQYGIKNGVPPGDKSGNIPSLFDITVPIPPEIMQQRQTPQEENKPKLNENKPDKPTKVRHTRWNDEPPVPVVPLLNQTFVGGMGSAFSTLNLQDQQKIQEYQLNYQLKGFYSEQDQDMRINSNGDVDMRALPQMLPKSEPSMNFDQFQKDNKNIPEPTECKKDVDIRNFGTDKLTIAEDTTRNDYSMNKKDTASISDTSTNLDSSLTIDEKHLGDTAPDLPSTLPKKQRELFLRIQAQQKENIPENQHSNPGTPVIKDDDWYSSDDDNDPLSKMVIHLEDEPKEDEKEEPEKSPERILSPPTIKPLEVFDKLGDLSKIDISAEVTKLLSSIKTNTVSVPTPSSSSSTTTEVKKSRDPRQAKNLDMEIKSPVLNSDPRTKPTKLENRVSRPSIYEQGYINTDESRLSIYDQGSISGEPSGKGDVDLRNLDALPKDLDMRPNFGDTDLRQGMRQDVDLRQLGLQFKGIQNYTPATEIDASVGSHSPIPYKVHVVDIPRPDYSGLKLSPQDAQVNTDPRLRKIFRLPSTEEKDSPASPKQTTPSPVKPVRQDPRRRNIKEPSEPSKQDSSNLSYSQQLHLLQSSAFYQSLTSNQKLMLNQEIASKGDQNASSDPLLAGILSSLGLIPSLSTANGCAMNILANVNSMVPAMNQMNPALMGPNMGGMPQNLGPNMAGSMGPNIAPGLSSNMASMGANMGQSMGQNMGQGMGQNMGQGMGQGMGQNMHGMNPNGPNPNIPGITPNLGPGLLGPAPNLVMGPSGPQNDFQINFDPRNGGLLGPAPFQNFQENQNFNYNDEFYPENEDNNFNTNNNNNYPRNERNFRNDRSQNNRRGRSWNNRHNNSRNYNRNNRNRSNRSYTPP